MVYSLSLVYADASPSGGRCYVDSASHRRVLVHDTGLPSEQGRIFACRDLSSSFSRTSLLHVALPSIDDESLALRAALSALELFDEQDGNRERFASLAPLLPYQ